MESLFTPVRLCKQYNTRLHWRTSDDFIRLRKGKELVLPRERYTLKQQRTTVGCRDGERTVTTVDLGSRVYLGKLREFPDDADWEEDKYDYAPHVANDEFSRAHGGEGRINPLRTTFCHGPSHVASQIAFRCNHDLRCLDMVPPELRDVALCAGLSGDHDDDSAADG